MAKKVEIDIRFLIVAIALVIVASVGSAFTAYLMLSNSETHFAGDNPADSHKKSQIGPTYDVGEFTVNLAGTSTLRFIRTGIVLELDNKNAVSEIEGRQPQVRDQIISVLRTCTLTDLNAENGLEKLRMKISNSINDLLINGEVSNVFFIDLVFQ
ncbi:MAG: hypothetical protein GX994_00280 [Firmicutes bacterium]|nr:hypothetical protein [Bacillota bacterium]